MRKLTKCSIYINESTLLLGITLKINVTMLRIDVGSSTVTSAYLILLAPYIDSVPQTMRTKQVRGLSCLNTRRLSANRYARGMFYRRER